MCVRLLRSGVHERDWRKHVASAGWWEGRVGVEHRTLDGVTVAQNARRRDCSTERSTAVGGTGRHGARRTRVKGQ